MSNVRCLPHLGDGAHSEGAGSSYFETPQKYAPPASERRGKTLTCFKDLYVKAAARTWPGLSCMCNVRCLPPSGAGPQTLNPEPQATFAAPGLYARMQLRAGNFFSVFITLGLEVGDTKVYEP
jgi:hypothetical protein